MATAYQASLAATDLNQAIRDGDRVGAWRAFLHLDSLVRNLERALKTRVQIGAMDPGTEKGAEGLSRAGP